ncbi:MAG TPA: hypothetical protein VFK13_00530 [Gemmatimonadaceae bacterium]|nr:hypothetical protein [Gemmatimonadaceae bacterium]
MRIVSCVAAAVVAFGGVGSAAAQGSGVVDPRCTDPSIVGATLDGGDACQKVVDIFKYLNPQLGVLVTGGNATLGQGGTLGGLGHFTVGLRVNVLRTSLPDVDAVGVDVGPAQSSAYPSDKQLAPLPVVDASIGILKGIPLGITRLGGLDLLLSAFYVPEFSTNGLDVTTPESSLKVGYGARLGVLQESAIVPGVSVTWFRRDLPTLAMRGNVEDDTVSLSSMRLNTTAWRVVVSKNLLLLGLAAGVGRDNYHTTTSVTYVVHDGGVVTRPAAPIPLEEDPWRTNAFLDVTLNLPVFKVLGEVGRVSGGDLKTFNTFDPDPNATRYYGTLGFRVQF